MRKEFWFLQGNIKLHFILILFFSGIHVTNAQNSILDVGVRFQKSINFYYENGVTLQYTNDRLLSQRLYLGLSYISSRLGSALGSNAIKQDNYIVSSTYFFRPLHQFQPFIRLNTGYFYADYEVEVFDELPNSSVLLSPETGISYRTNIPLKIGASFGYNLITGNGNKGAGTIYPLFIQSSLTWSIFNKNQSDE